MLLTELTNPLDVSILYVSAILVITVEDILDALLAITDVLIPDIEEIIKAAIENILIPLLESFDIDWIGDVADFLQGVADLTETIEEAIKTWLCTGKIGFLNIDPIGICFPDFPDLDDMLNFNLETYFSQWLPNIPDFEVDFTNLINSALNIPQNIIDKLGDLSERFNILPIWIDCADESTPDDAISCLLSALNIPITPSSILEEESGVMAIVETLLNPDDVIAEEM